jgi:hypothetical protein
MASPSPPFVSPPAPPLAIPNKHRWPLLLLAGGVPAGVPPTHVASRPQATPGHAVAIGRHTESRVSRSPQRPSLCHHRTLPYHVIPLLSHRLAWPGWPGPPWPELSGPMGVHGPPGAPPPLHRRRRGLPLPEQQAPNDPLCLNCVRDLTQ